MAHLSDFLAVGKFGPLELGQTIDDVVATLGQADARSAKQEPLLIRYGDLQLAFDQNKLSLIALYFRIPRSPVPAVLRFDDYSLDERTSRQEFEAWMQQRGIPFSIDQSLTFGEQSCLRT